MLQIGRRDVVAWGNWRTFSEVRTFLDGSVVAHKWGIVGGRTAVDVGVRASANGRHRILIHDHCFVRQKEYGDGDQHANYTAVRKHRSIFFWSIRGCAGGGAGHYGTVL